MTCKEIHEQITAYVDDRVDEQEYRSKVQQHIKYCPDCRAAYELELMTKVVVRERSERASAPESLRTAISSGVESMAEERKEEIAQTTRARREHEGWFDRFSGYFTSPIGVVAALLLVVFGTYVITRSSDRGADQIIVDKAKPGADSGAAPASAVPENFFNKAANNFSAIMNGSLSVQHVSSDKEELGRYFKENGISYDVAFLPLHGSLEGGVISQHDRTRLAHIVYTNGEATIYVFEVPHDILAKGNIVYVTSDVLKQLDEGKTFWEEPGGHAMAMFAKNGVICAVVSNAKKGEMQKILGI